MKRLLCLLLIASWGAAGAEFNPDGSLTCYLQLVRGTNDPKPQDVNWKPIGPKLSKRLATVFRWNYYWEVSCHPLSVTKAKPAKTRVGTEREVEIRLAGDNESELRLFRKGKLVRTSRQSLDARMHMTGWDREKDEAWFVVVRTEKPQ